MVRRRKAQPLAFLVVALAVVLTGWWQQQSGAPAPAPSAVEGSPPAGPAASSPPASSRLDPIPADHRPQLEQTLALIAKGGPFPYEKDGTVFQNREGKLPQRPRGYYREYTVPTPGASNRGARRVVQGRDGDTWYTSDHYKTFVRIDE
ncbi:MAG TPA: ribonuclease domain-containing protein [Thermoanaerobaculia bacterium]|nr:ribonuclease domain-containing protein [Thermoanaerobaculia bacterium]